METADTIDIKVFDALSKQGINGLTKSAVIYRDDTARFIYVCFHCGSMFNEISATLQHIESHFQLANVMVDQTATVYSQLNGDGNDIKDELATATNTENLGIKTEVPDEFDDIHLAITAVPIIHASSEDERPGKQKDIRTEKPKKVRSSSAAVKVKRKKNPKESPYRCHVCNRICKNITTLRDHIGTHPKTEQLRTNRCKKCDEYFKSAATLRKHVHKVHLVTLTETTEDDFTRYEQTGSFTEHPYSCEFCMQKFYIKSNLDLHMNAVHSSGRRLQCSTCYAVFDKPMIYYAHQSEHQRGITKAAEFDEIAALARIDALTGEHIIREEGQPYRCLMCSMTAELIHDLRAHIRKKHVYPMFPPPVEPKKEFICDYCGVCVKSKDALTKHFLRHTNTKSYPCRFCGKFFRLASTTKIHERQHTGEKPYQCHECGKTFVSKGLMTAHKKNHEEKTYTCHICGKVLKYEANYRNHMRTHRVERDHKCTVCSKDFNNRLNLRKHMEIHSARRHKCYYCDSTFNTPDGRRQHQRHRHKSEMNLPM